MGVSLMEYSAVAKIYLEKSVKSKGTHLTEGNALNCSRR
jgi:hypothetical protein